MQKRLQRVVQAKVAREKNRLVVLEQRIVNAVRRMVVREEGKLNLWRKTIDLHSPERIYKMGYSLTMANGKIVRRREDVSPGDVVETYLQDGVIQSEVK
jgi:exodeoxyribonuclease VII large subunit